MNNGALTDCSHGCRHLIIFRPFFFILHHFVSSCFPVHGDTDLRINWQGILQDGRISVELENSTGACMLRWILLDIFPVSLRLAGENVLTGDNKDRGYRPETCHQKQLNKSKADLPRRSASLISYGAGKEENAIVFSRGNDPSTLVGYCCYCRHCSPAADTLVMGNNRIISRANSGSGCILALRAKQ